MPRRLLPLVVAALVSVAGCTTVDPAPHPGAAGSRRALPPDAAARPSVPRTPASEPAAGAALVRTGDGPPGRPGPAARTRGPVSGGGPAPAVPRTAPAAPAPQPRAKRRPPAGPAPRPRTASRPPAAVMRDLCRRADGVAAPEIVRLCRETYG
ncbi:hypothetical protein [Streptomyces rubradiris]|uniref:hypothetical protein n=1 Tax=Streptomyces rubradiris TaxID=285531 RepID=UPI001E32B48A|nr:hypothetical protein [Streptomyces rubradiris]